MDKKQKLRDAAIAEKVRAAIEEGKSDNEILDEFRSANVDIGLVKRLRDQMLLEYHAKKHIMNIIQFHMIDSQELHNLVVFRMHHCEDHITYKIRYAYEQQTLGAHGGLPPGSQWWIEAMEVVREKPFEDIYFETYHEVLVKVVKEIVTQALEEL